MAWIIHNYHISRSAGPIAARMAMRSPVPDLRAFFMEDSLEEYWHCDAFYFAGAGELALRPDMVKAYVPLAASTAFEDQALRTADEDWLGHLLIAYFQEASILFRDDSETFYDAVEEAYGIGGFFAGWRRHMTLDLDHGHADGLRSMFDSDAHIALPDLVRSFRSVQLAHFFLIRALDQIAVHADVVDALGARQPAAFIGSGGQTAPRVGETRCAGNQDEVCGRHLVAALGDASFLALANSRSHDDIVMAGRLAAAVSQMRDEYAPLVGTAKTIRDVGNPWIVAVRNFVVERSPKVSVVVELAGDLLAAAKGFDPNLKTSDLHRQLEHLATQLPHDRATIERAQLRELLTLARIGGVLQPLVLGGAPAAFTLPTHHAQA
ncbi:hypothetical protein GXW74_21440 [Roseomonas eburnea]|uniref:Uncharacterized protein n=1 Tax=Neoroseomonas eburnea TaxID=1346889 RepID=A0A9X9XH82_9PROT|nr:hypothetical protein [Neoroseomonas eburnea]MBR0683068.1 hypothetical protein [Neoroseomonas eburnea]